MITLCPLLQMSWGILANPDLKGRWTDINRKIQPWIALPIRQRENTSPEKKAEYLSRPPAFAYYSLFIYAGHDLLPTYTLVSKKQDDITTNWYLIDFKNAYELQCPKIVKPDNSPLESKVLQVSDQTREDLRRKIAAYYARVPNEEKQSK